MVHAQTGGRHDDAHTGRDQEDGPHLQSEAIANAEKDIADADEEAAEEAPAAEAVAEAAAEEAPVEEAVAEEPVAEVVAEESADEAAAEGDDENA